MVSPKHTQLKLKSYNRTINMINGTDLQKEKKKNCIFFFIQCIFREFSYIWQNQTKPLVTLSANEILKFKCVLSCVILQARPMADKEKSPWNRSLMQPGSCPRAASVEPSITPVLNSWGRHRLQDTGNKSHWVGEFYNLCARGETKWEKTVTRKSLSRPTFLLNDKEACRYVLLFSCWDSLDGSFWYSHWKPSCPFIAQQDYKTHTSIILPPRHINSFASFKHLLFLLCLSPGTCVVLLEGEISIYLHKTRMRIPVWSVDLAPPTNCNKDTNKSWQTQTV